MLDNLAPILRQLRDVDFFDGSERSLAGCELEHLCDEIGITRTASTTLLDRVGVNTWYAIRPSAIHPACVYSSGKSFNKDFARIGATFEAYERWAAEEPRFQVHDSSGQFQKAASQHGICVLELPDGPEGSNHWALGKNLITDAPVAAPIFLVQFPTSGPPNFIATTTGYAAHVSFVKATENALLECVERNDAAHLSPEYFLRISPSLLSDAASEIFSSFNRERIEAHIFLISDPTASWFSVYCYAYDHWLEYPQMHCSGFGCSFSFRDAIDKAMLEVCQSRVAFITGLRSDVATHVKPKHFDQPAIETQRNWLDTLRSVKVSAGAIAATHRTSLREFIIEEFNRGSLPHVLAFPMRTARGFPAVKVIIPNLHDSY